MRRVVDEPGLSLLAVGGFIHQVDGCSRHDRRDRMLIHELRMPVAAQEDAKVIEPGNDALQLHAVHEEDRQRRFAFANVIEKRVLQILSAVSGHCCSLLFF